MSFALWLACLLAFASAREYNVAVTGDDGGDGSPAHPLRTVQRAATLAQGGDVVTVHAGVYRERVAPPRGGVTYQAAPGDAVTLTGAQPATGWLRAGGDTWSLTLPSYATFGNFNPYSDRIRGDWFGDNGLVHHTGAVYLGEMWIKESPTLAAVMAPLLPGATPMWFGLVDGDAGNSLVNLMWIMPRGGVAVSAGMPSWRYGTKPYNGTEGPCAAYISTGDVLRFDGVDFGASPTTALDIRAAAAPGMGAVLEVRAGDRWGLLLGTAAIPSTGDWEAWANFTIPLIPTSGVQNISIVFLAPGYSAGNTTIFAQFPGGADPNAASVEINVRQTVFYPSAPFVSNITVRGFTLERAATQWAPPSAEQVGAIGTHWSQGWLIEGNVVRQSACSCVSLGKYGDGYDNTNDAGQADPYTACVRRALDNGWHRGVVGSHVVRGNRISECGQTGVVGSMGGAFSVVEDNEISECNWQVTFGGAEMAGVKLHGAVDTVIRNNHIYNASVFGIWLDWMAQGAVVTSNLIHDAADCVIFTEVDHGPYTVVNNIFLGPSPALCANSAGGAYAHNLIAGAVQHNGADARLTPVLVPHASDIAAMAQNDNGDHKLFNNVLVAPAGFAVVDDAVQPCVGRGNVYAGAASPGPSKFETQALVNASFDAGVALTRGPAGEWLLAVRLDPQWPAAQPRALVNTSMLGVARVPGQNYTWPDASSLAVDVDYFGRPRDQANPRPGALEAVGDVMVQVWPKAAGARPQLGARGGH